MAGFFKLLYFSRFKWSNHATVSFTEVRGLGYLPTDLGHFSRIPNRSDTEFDPHFGHAPFWSWTLSHGVCASCGLEQAPNLCL